MAALLLPTPRQCLLISLIAVLLALSACSCRMLKSIQDHMQAPLDYAVLGQQKCGTSTLWMNLQSHPDITWVGKYKEVMWFNGDRLWSSRCDNDLDTYQRAVLYARGDNAARLVGDWSATHLSCLCCPPVFRMMNANMKLIVVLRDPIERALSRFAEQKALATGPLHDEVVNETFASYVAKEIGRLHLCSDAATRFDTQQQHQRQQQQGAGGGAFAGASARRRRRQHQQQGQDEQQLIGWGAGMDLGAWMSAQCFTKSNIVGWSAYDVFLGNYLAHFPPEQLLVLYTDELATDPLGVVRRLEAFLRVRPGNYTAEGLALVYNSRGCYAWSCAKNKSDVASAAVSSSSSSGDRSSLRSGATGRGGGGTGWLSSRLRSSPAQDPAFSLAVSQLADLYRPHMGRLFEWADRGRIAQPPPAWRGRYQSAFR